jgi:hypothetical protein
MRVVCFLIDKQVELFAQQTSKKCTSLFVLQISAHTYSLLQLYITAFGIGTIGQYDLQRREVQP